MMNFRTIKDGIGQTLCDHQGSDFRVVGYQKQTKSAREVTNDNRLVQIYYAEGEFPGRAHSNQYSAKHNLRFNIEFTVSAAATGDIATATDASATAKERADAIANIKEASEKVDNQLDDLIDRVYQIIMDAKNRDFGLAVGTLSGRMIERIKKDDTIEEGELVVKTALMDLSCSTVEEIAGYVDPDPGSAKIIDNVIEMASTDEVQDDIQKTGLETTTPAI
jgi:hypothetical protein